VLTVVSVIYLLWLAWRIAHAAPPEPGAAKGEPLTFVQAAAFQWVNPKAWAMAQTAVTIYAPGDTALAIFAVAALFGAINLPSVSTWCLLGQGMQRVLTDQRRLTVFNWTMAVLLVLSLYPLVI
ncbi:MAG: LysE family translocator, partial [Boseongicola sp.]